jgi:hypothetical protein
VQPCNNPGILFNIWQKERPMRTIWNKPLLAICALLPLLAAASRPAIPFLHDSLSGKWAITITPDDETRQAGERDIKDTITFKQPNFTSEAFEKRGFQPAVYDEEMHPGGAGQFSAVQTNKTEAEGTAKWSGLITATEITGDLIIKKKDGTILNFSYTGSKQ